MILFVIPTATSWLSGFIVEVVIFLSRKIITSFCLQYFRWLFS